MTDDLITEYLDVSKKVKNERSKKRNCMMYISVDGSIGFITMENYFQVKKIFNRVQAVKAVRFELVDDIHETYYITTYTLLTSGEITSHREVLRLG